MKVIAADGLGPLLYLTSWALIRAVDMNLHLAGETGSVLIKKRKGRVAGFGVTQDTLWLAAEAA